MATKGKKKNVTVYLIPEGETRDSHTYHYTAVKTKTLIQENRKLKMKKTQKRKNAKTAKTRKRKNCDNAEKRK